MRLNFLFQVLESLFEDGFLISEVARLLCVSERTVYRRMSAYGIRKQKFTILEEDELDVEVIKVTTAFPFCGKLMLKELLRERGIVIQSLHRVDSDGINQRKQKRLHRRIYNVQGPNHLWHLDTNHKLVRWYFIITRVIDGFSRLPVVLKCTDNNKATTFFGSFLTAVENSEYQVELEAIRA